MQTLCSHFGLDDAAKLTWAHGVNNRAYLEECCADPGLHMVEGDVHFASADALPCMAHDWQHIADLDVGTWLSELVAAGKGIKIDFADPAAVEPTLATLGRLKPAAPVILHANVFSLLPEDAQSAADGLEPEQFVRLCQQYCPAAILSLGWSLKREADADGRMEEVLIHQMADMTLKRLGGMAYNIEIRAGYTTGWERGAALIFEPLGTMPPAETTGASNVVQATHLFRKTAA